MGEGHPVEHLYGTVNVSRSAQSDLPRRLFGCRIDHVNHFITCGCDPRSVEIDLCVIPHISIAPNL
jgi:hypothetical protein